MKKILVIAGLCFIMLFCSCSEDEIIVNNKIYSWLWNKLLLPDKELADLIRDDFNTISYQNLVIEDDIALVYDYSISSRTDIVRVHSLLNKDTTWFYLTNLHEKDYVAIRYQSFTPVSIYKTDSTISFDGEHIFYKTTQIIRYDFDVSGNLTRIAFENEDYKERQHRILWYGPRIITPLKDYLENNGYELESTDDTYTYYSKNGVNVRYERRGNLDELGWYNEVILIDRP